jgi:hypothetical protein
LSKHLSWIKLFGVELEPIRINQFDGVAFLGLGGSFLLDTSAVEIVQVLIERESV